jgi:ABC-type transport system involved in multi-copper enzyme maturation permease subunit
MLWYKAWLESRTRFILSAVTIAGLSVGFVLFHRDGAKIFDRPPTYVEYIWELVYKGYLRELFVVLALLLGIGGLLRERDFGTAGFTLSLPVSRLRLLSVRAALGLAQVVALSLLPALLIPAISPLRGESYPWAQALQFALLWAVVGALIFMLGFLASSLFGGEYTALVVAFLGLIVYSIISDLPFFERHSLDVHDIMSGTGMKYFPPKGSALIGPLPWNALTVILLIGFSLAALSGRITRQQDF